MPSKFFRDGTKPREVQWVDFGRLRHLLPLSLIISHYGLDAELKRVGSHQLRGKCPIHQGTRGPVPCHERWQEVLGGGRIAAIALIDVSLMLSIHKSRHTSPLAFAGTHSIVAGKGDFHGQDQEKTARRSADGKYAETLCACLSARLANELGDDSSRPKATTRKSALSIDPHVIR